MIVTVRARAWDEQVNALAKRLNPVYGLAALQGLVDRGEVKLYDVIVQDNRLGVIITRIDTGYNGTRELVVMHAVSEVKPAQPLTSVLAPVFEAIAKTAGADKVRVHSDRRGIDKLLEDNGYSFSETVFIKEVK